MKPNHEIHETHEGIDIALKLRTGEDRSLSLAVLTFVPVHFEMTI